MNSFRCPGVLIFRQLYAFFLPILSLMTSRFFHNTHNEKRLAFFLLILSLMTSRFFTILITKNAWQVKYAKPQV